MIRATWNGALLAESDQTILVEGNHYFPPNSVDKQYFLPSDTRTVCSWKGDASYYHLEVDGEINQDAAWYYAAPKEEAAKIKNYVAFWKGVQVD